MINTDKEFYSSPYYFLLRDKGNKYSLYFSVEKTLSEARKKDDVMHFKKEFGNKLKKHINKITKEKKLKTTSAVKKDLEELVNQDGSLSNSKVPILDPTLHPRKTMDQTVSAARITNDPITRGYRTYYGESVDEIDMSKAFGYDETENLDGKETYKYFRKKLEMDADEAKERTKQQGKDPSGKKDKNSKYKNDKNFISRQTISEIQRQKMLKVVEDILVNKNTNKQDIANNESNVSAILKKNIKSLKNQAEKEGLSISELIKLIKSE
jgi:hypothetical protein